MAGEEEALESQVDAAVSAVEGDQAHETPEAPATPTYSEDELSRARQFGLDAKDFVDADDLRRTLDRYDRTLVARWKQQQEAEQQWYQQQARQQIPPQQQVQQPHQWVPPQLRKEWSYGLNEQLADPEFAKALDSALQQQMDYIHSHMAAMAQVLAHQQQQQGSYIQQVEAARAEQEMHQRMGQFYDALNGVNREDLFGDKTYKELKQDSKEWQNQAKLYNAIEALENGYRFSGMDPGDMKTLVQRAFRDAFPEEYEKSIRQSVIEKATSASRRKLGSGSRTARKAVSSPRDDEDYGKDPVLREFWKKAHEESGLGF